MEWPNARCRKKLKLNDRLIRQEIETDPEAGFRPVRWGRVGLLASSAAIALGSVSGALAADLTSGGDQGLLDDQGYLPAKTTTSAPLAENQNLQSPKSPKSAKSPKSPKTPKTPEPQAPPAPPAPPAPALPTENRSPEPPTPDPAPATSESVERPPIAPPDAEQPAAARAVQLTDAQAAAVAEALGGGLLADDLKTMTLEEILTIAQARGLTTEQVLQLLQGQTGTELRDGEPVLAHSGSRLISGLAAVVATALGALGLGAWVRSRRLG